MMRGLREDEGSQTEGERPDKTPSPVAVGEPGDPVEDARCQQVADE